MLLHRWCPFLMRTMSPLAVGLIWFFFIGVSSLSFHPPSPENYSTHPTASAVVKLKKNAIHSSFAKDYAFHQTKVSTKAPTVSVKVLSSSRPIIGNGSRKGIETSSKAIPNLNLSLKLKVRNGSETNSTIVYLPRLSRSMVNFSRSAVNKDYLPIIVSSHRRDLLNPKEYIIRSASHTRDLPKLNISTHFGSKLKQKGLQISTTTKPRKFGLKFSESSPKNVRTFSTQKVRNVFKTGSPNAQSSSESAVLVNIKRTIENGLNTKVNSSTFQFLPATNSKNQNNRNFLRKQRRRGRNFDIAAALDSGEQETNSDIIISLPMFTETAKLSDATHDGEISKLFDYNYNVSSSNKDSSYPHIPTFQTEEERLLSDLGYSYAEKKAKNLTIYEILKPRLKNSENSSETFDFSPDQNSFSLTNDAVSHQVKDIEDSPVSNSSKVNSPEEEEIGNHTLVTNGIEYETSKYANSIVILPGRSDSSYGIEYVMVNRSSSSVISSFNANETGLDTTAEDDKENNNSTSTGFTEQESSVNLETDNIQKRGGEINEERIISEKEMFHEQVEENNEDTYFLGNNSTAPRPNTSEENLSADGSEYMTLMYESDTDRRPKMSENVNSDNVPYKNPKIDSKMFYDYFAKKPIGNITLREFPYPEYRPGNMFRYSDVYQRKPILDVVYTRSTPILRLAKTTPNVVTEETVVNPTTFNSLRTSIRAMSTYYPNRMQDVTMKFGNRIESTTVPNFHSNEKRPDYRNEDDPDDAEYKDSIDTGFTMEKLAYLLIGTCCGLSILCLFVVVIAIKCRRAIVEKRLKAQFRKRMYHHERMKDIATPWQQQMFDHFMYLHRRPADSSCSSNTDSCNCRCVTWSLGARNLDATRPLCPTSRNSLYLYGQKKLPFGAASTLRFESMLGRKRSSPDNNQHKTDSPNTDSSHENDSLDLDSDSREGDGPKQCTCIDYNVWPMPPTNVPRGFYTLCPNAGRYNGGNCSQHPSVELRTISRDIPPPVTGSNYLDRSEGVVYWSSNEERLI